MSRAEVREALCKVKVYADFGSHPGRDRMPREAALCGACVLTNRRGSANFAEDVPLPTLYKLDQDDPAFAQNVGRTIRGILATRPFQCGGSSAFAVSPRVQRRISPPRFGGAPSHKLPRGLPFALARRAE